MRDEAGPDVAHDPFADQRVQIPLVDPDHRGEQCGGDHPADVEENGPHRSGRYRVVDEPLREERREEPQKRADDDARKSEELGAPVWDEEAAKAPPVTGLRTCGFSGLNIPD